MPLKSDDTYGGAILVLLTAYAADGHVEVGVTTAPVLKP
jgi:hypothetical protein